MRLYDDDGGVHDHVAVGSCDDDDDGDGDDDGWTVDVGSRQPIFTEIPSQALSGSQGFGDPKPSKKPKEALRANHTHNKHDN